MTSDINAAESAAEGRLWALTKGLPNGMCRCSVCGSVGTFAAMLPRDQSPDADPVCRPCAGYEGPRGLPAWAPLMAAYVDAEDWTWDPVEASWSATGADVGESEAIWTRSDGGLALSVGSYDHIIDARDHDLPHAAAGLVAACDALNAAWAASEAPR